LTYFPIALILLPTQELAQQTYLEVLKLAYRTPLVPALIHGGQDNYAPQVDTFKLGCDILVATPLRLIEMTKNSDIDLSHCSFLVMDESDRLLDSDFAKQTGAIINQLPTKEERTTGRLKVQLENDNYDCLLFHADVSGSRDHILDDFKSGKIRILIASDALARGIDVENVTHVINYDTPEAQQNYQHRVGRTARMGREGTSITFVNELTNIIVNLYDLVNGEGDLPEKMIALGRSQLKAFTSGYLGEGSQYFSENPDMYTQEVETYNEVEIRTHDPEYYEE
uniref:Uncharacterized protein n=1 Tax=Meloidogyne floridensis TaxID=298350 RepID=A0A915NLH0_9BILA